MVRTGFISDGAGVSSTADPPTHPIESKISSHTPEFSAPAGETGHGKESDFERILFAVMPVTLAMGGIEG